MADHAEHRRPSLAVPFGLLGAAGSYLVMSGWLRPGRWPDFAITGVVMPAVASVLIGLWFERRAERGASIGWLALVVAMFLGGATAGSLTCFCLAIVGGVWRDAGDLTTLPLVTMAGALFGGVMTFAFVPTFALVFAAWRRTGRARFGTPVDKTDRQRLWSTTTVGLCLYALAMFHSDTDVDPSPQWLALYIALGAFVVAGCCLVANVRRQRQVAAVTRDLHESSEAVDDDSTFDLGLGDQSWTLDAIAIHPYRGAARAVSAVKGSVDVARRVLRSGTALSAVTLAVSVVTLTRFPSGQEYTIEEKLYADAAAPLAAVAEAPTCAGYSWYNARAPLPIDVNGDGVKDVVGLRWNSAREGRSLAVAAVDGVSHRELWCQEGIPSQWGSSRTQLVRSGDHLYLADSEQLLRTYHLKDGTQVAPPMAVPELLEMCAGEDGRLWYRSELDGLEGRETDPQGTQYPAPRPATCGHRGAQGQLSCWRGSDAPGRGMTWVRNDQPDVGQLVLHDSPRRRTPDAKEPLELAAFSVSGERCEELWRAPITFATDRLHRDPQMNVMAHGDVIYTYYQLHDGSWRLGARSGITGHVLWTREPARTNRGSSFHSLTAADDRLYVGLQWRLDMHDSRSGEPMASIPF